MLFQDNDAGRIIISYIPHKKVKQGTGQLNWWGHKAKPKVIMVKDIHTVLNLRIVSYGFYIPIQELLQERPPPGYHIYVMWSNHYLISLIYGDVCCFPEVEAHPIYRGVSPYDSNTEYVISRTIHYNMYRIIKLIPKILPGYAARICPSSKLPEFMTYSGAIYAICSNLKLHYYDDYPYYVVTPQWFKIKCIQIVHKDELGESSAKPRLTIIHPRVMKIMRNCVFNDTNSELQQILIDKLGLLASEMHIIQHRIPARLIENLPKYRSGKLVSRYSWRVLCDLVSVICAEAYPSYMNNYYCSKAVINCFYGETGTIGIRQQYKDNSIKKDMQLMKKAEKFIRNQKQAQKYNNSVGKKFRRY